MSLHEDIQMRLARAHEGMAHAISITPASLALAVMREYSPDALEPHIEYGCYEHFKHMGRKFLAGRHNADGDENPAHQGELFSGHLQDRYPVPRKAGEEPVYKLREHLTAQERAWNVAALRKSAEARLLHADALEAEALAADERVSRAERAA